LRQHGATITSRISRLFSAAAAKAHGIHWLHVDYEPHLDMFYKQCGFQPTLAGLMRLNG